MDTDKALLLGVTVQLPQMAAYRRPCRLVMDSIYGPFIRYEDEQDRVTLNSSFIRELLNLVPPFLPRDFPEIGSLRGPSEDDLPEHVLLQIESQPEEVVAFLNRWGMVGRISDLFHSPMYQDYYPMEGLEFEDSKLSWEEKIRIKDTIPYDFVVDELIRMARCTRFVFRLLTDAKANEEHFFLNQRTRKRIISGWGFLPLEVPEEKDPASYKSLSEVWIEKTTYRGRKYKYVEMAEIAAAEFAQKMNTYLKPISKVVIRTQELEKVYEGHIGLETALATYLLQKIQIAGAPLQCQNCKGLYFPDRRKVDAKYCSENCGSAVRTRKYRQKSKSDIKSKRGK